VIGTGRHFSETASEYITAKTHGGRSWLLDARGCGSAWDRTPFAGAKCTSVVLHRNASRLPLAARQ